MPLRTKENTVKRVAREREQTAPNFFDEAGKRFGRKRVGGIPSRMNWPKKKNIGRNAFLVNSQMEPEYYSMSHSS